MTDTLLETTGYERIDLHTHSHHSDGTLAPEELVALAADRHVQLLSLTDHDTLAGCAAAATACAQRQIEFLYGSELTALWRGREIQWWDCASTRIAARSRPNCTRCCSCGSNGSA